VAVLSGLVVASIAHPAWGTHDYEARTRLYSPAAARDTQAGQPAPLVDPFALKPDAVAALATSRQTAARVAEAIGYDGDPLRIVERVRATADSSAGTITIAARRRGDPRGARVIANTVADQLIELVDESRATARARAIDEARTRAADLQQQLSAVAGSDSGSVARRADLLHQSEAASAEADRLEAAAETSGVSSIQPAVARRLPSHAVETLPPIVGWALTLLLLAGLGAGLAVAVELTGERIEGAAAIAGATGLPLIGVLPPPDAGDGKAEVDAHDRLERAVASRITAAAPPPTTSFMVPKAAAGHIVLITSPGGDDGTTEATIGFAQAVAATGRTALIVDCDDAAEANSDGRGLGDVAEDGIVLPSLASLVRSTSMERVSLVPRGRPSGRAADFLARHDQLLRSSKALADVVILHGPNILSGPAPAALAAKADDTMLVCRAGTTSLADAKQAAIALYDAGADAALVVFESPESAEAAPLVPAEFVERVKTDERLRGRLEWVAAAIFMFALYLVIRSFVFESFSIPTASMSPYLKPGDRVLVSRMSYRLHAVHRGDVIVFKTPPNAKTLGGSRLIKRVIALPGETVESKDGKLFVDDKPLPERYLTKGVSTTNVKRQQVPGGRYWVMGDNRGNSADSRFFGTIKKNSIIGRAFFHLWPTPIGLM
jgi:signal peptidase I